MHNSMQPPKSLRIQWDESNLSQNEKIKAELNTTKIEEPKTPFHSPPQGEFDVDGEITGNCCCLIHELEPEEGFEHRESSTDVNIKGGGMKCVD